jgi:hypothetical protein
VRFPSSPWKLMPKQARSPTDPATNLESPGKVVSSRYRK